jgi:hypothetical protein
MPWLKLGEASQPLGEAVQGLGRGWVLTEKTGHNDRAWAVMAGGGARFPRRTPVIFGSGGALGARVQTAKASRGTYRRGQGADAWGRATTRGARAAAASPRSTGQASDRTCGLSQSGHFQTLIGSRSSRNSPKSLHTICFFFVYSLFLLHHSSGFDLGIVRYEGAKLGLSLG